MLNMDQAKTLRHLLGQSQTEIHPILGDMSHDYAACVGRFALEQRAKSGLTALLFDGSERGLSVLLANAADKDLVGFFQGKSNLEDLVVRLADQQFLVNAKAGLEALRVQVDQAPMLLGKLHRLPTTCDCLYATLPYQAIELAQAFSRQGAWIWVVQPTAKSVTQTFRAMRSTGVQAAEVQHHIVVAGVRDAAQADHVFSDLLETTARFVEKPLQYAGHMPALNQKMPLSHMTKEMIVAGRRIAKAMCSLDEHAYA